MQVSSNIVRFPYATAPTAVQRRPDPPRQDEDNVVSFAGSSATPAPDAHEHGMMFAAHRIATRVADELEQTAVL